MLRRPILSLGGLRSRTSRNRIHESSELDPAGGQLRSMHAREQFPVERFGRHGMERNRFHPMGIVIGHHAADDALRLLDEAADRFVRQMLRDDLIFRRGGRAAQGMSENRSLGGRGERIVPGGFSPRRLGGNGLSHIVD